MDDCVQLKPLTSEEVLHLSLPLRYRILHEELHWVGRNIAGPLDLRDPFDDASLHLGLFVGQLLIGTGRLVIADDTDSLPSGFHIPKHSDATRNVGEISRIVIHEEWRGLRAFVALFYGLIFEAASNQLDGVFLTIVETKRHKVFLNKHGFRRLQGDFFFSDQVISPPKVAALFFLDFKTFTMPTESFNANKKAALEMIASHFLIRSGEIK